MIEPEELAALLRGAFPDAIVAVRDTTGTRDHFEASITSAQFEGRGLVERHRMVYAALGDAMKQRIHALSLKTHTPTENARKG